MVASPSSVDWILPVASIVTRPRINVMDGSAGGELDRAILGRSCTRVLPEAPVSVLGVVSTAFHSTVANSVSGPDPVSVV